MTWTRTTLVVTLRACKLLTSVCVFLEMAGQLCIAVPVILLAGLQGQTPEKWHSMVMLVEEGKVSTESEIAWGTHRGCVIKHKYWTPVYHLVVAADCTYAGVMIQSESHDLGDVRVTCAERPLHDHHSLPLHPQFRRCFCYLFYTTCSS